MTHRSPFRIICIGCSKGGITTLPLIIAPLPVDFGCPIVIVQHLKEGTGEFWAHLLDEQCHIQVVEAQQLEIPEKGYAYTAPANYHLYIDREEGFSLSVDDKIAYSRPSIDVFFESVAHAYRSQALAILLTGANSDGTGGLVAIKRFGGVTIAQNPATADASAMPQAAINSGVVDYILTPAEISHFLLTMYT